MNYTVTKYPQGTFSWAHISSTDMKASKAFLTDLFGWTAEDLPTGTPGMDYTMFSLNGQAVAGGSPKPPGMEHTPSFWQNHITVDDVDAVTTSAQKLGAKVLAPPMDVMDAGRLSAIQDLTGAVVVLWQPKKNIGARVVNTVGAMSWNELYTHDLEASKKFYGELLHWTFENSKDADGTYVTIHNNGRMNGGIMPLQPGMDMPDNWTVYFTVKNLAESVAKVKKLGGIVHIESKDISVGKIAMATDPTGAPFMLMEMSVPPQEWVE